jgi:hypothetical protein
MKYNSIIYISKNGFPTTFTLDVGEKRYKANNPRNKRKYSSEGKFRSFEHVGCVVVSTLFW